jgi:hypothetical protein
MKHGTENKAGKAVQAALAQWGRRWQPAADADVLLALDDTDNLESPGTGFRARELALKLAQQDLARATAITRHQLLVHDDIPFTSHNSSACVVLHGVQDEARVFELACGYLSEAAAPGSDVGVVMLRRVRVPDVIRDWGRRAKREVLRLDDARALARSLADAAGLRHAELSGTGGGLIGSLAAVGLHVQGQDGRLLWLHGIRELAGQVLPVGEVEQRLGVQLQTEDGQAVADGVGALDLVDLGDWPRAVFRGHRPVLLVEVNHENLSRSRWRSLGRERVKQLSS